MTNMQTVVRVFRQLRNDLAVKGLRPGERALAYQMAVDELEETGVTASDVQQVRLAWERYARRYRWGKPRRLDEKDVPVWLLNLYGLVDLLNAMNLRDAGKPITDEIDDLPF